MSPHSPELRVGLLASSSHRNGFAFAPLGAKTDELHAEPLWNDRLVTLVGASNPLREPLTLEAYAAAAHLEDEILNGLAEIDERTVAIPGLEAAVKKAKQDFQEFVNAVRSGRLEALEGV